MLAPLAPGSTVITMSSGAALAGSPLSGGYAGAKAAIRFLTAYAASEAERDGLNIRFVSVLPQLTPATALGAAAVAAYAARAGADERSFAASLGATPTPELAGQAVASLATDPSLDQPAYLLTGAGLRPVG
jgi:NAD(P)-dependent dehydrogenase (short-subunit alcohol dehydrogenase family)